MEQGPARRPALPTVSFAAVGAAAVSLAVVAVPWLRMSFEAPSLRVALETGGSLLAVTTVVLLLRQCGLRSRADHLWLTAGLVVLARTALGVAGHDRRRRLVAGRRRATRWRGNLAGTLMLAIAAFAPTRKLRVRRARSCSARGRARRRRRRRWPPLLAGVGPALRAPDARWPSFHPELGRVIVQIAIAVSLVVAAVGLARRANERRSRCCAGSPSRSCSAASPSSTTRSSRRSAPTTSTSATCCAWPPGSRCSPACSARCAPRMRQRAEAAVDARAPPPRPRAARRRRAGARLHPPPRRPPDRARRTASRSSTPPTARSRIRGARSRRWSRPPTSRWQSRSSASARGWRPSAGSRCRSTCASRRGHARGPRRADPDHLRGGPQRRPPRRRAPRARRSRRARRCACA